MKLDIGFCDVICRDEITLSIINRFAPMKMGRRFPSDLLFQYSSGKSIVVADLSISVMMYISLSPIL